MENMYDHLLSRRLDPDAYSCVVCDDVAYLFLYTLTGKLAGYQKYNPLGLKDRRNDESQKYYCYVTNEGDPLHRRKGKKYLACFGVESLKPDTKYVFLVEGMFDATPFHKAGHACLALLKNDPKDWRNQLYLLSKKYTLVSVCDDDPAGKKLLKYGQYGFVCPNKKDVGDMSDEEFNKFLNHMLQEMSK